jgi:predicted nucleic acid-binding protein
VDIAVGLNHHLFDTLYHAVALEEGATLVTADEAYFAKAKQLGGIERLADFAV